MHKFDKMAEFSNETLDFGSQCTTFGFGTDFVIDFASVAIMTTGTRAQFKQLFTRTVTVHFGRIGPHKFSTNKTLAADQIRPEGYNVSLERV